jgi:invasion protein IalB
MEMRRLNVKRLVGVTLAATFLAHASFAQEETSAEAAPEEATEAAAATEIANNTAFGDWVVQCEAISVSRNICRIVQELTLVDSDELVVRFIALPAADGTAILLAQVPIGVYLPGGAVYRLADREEDPQREMIWQRCLGDLCEAALQIEPDELANFTASGAILFGYRPDIEAEPVIVRADMARFAEAIEAIRAAN